MRVTRPLPSILLATAILAAPAAAQAQDPTLHVDLGGGASLEMVLVPGGTFVQGSPAGEKGRDESETAHEARLGEAYYLGKVPVTVGQFARFVARTGYRTEAERGKSGGFGWDGHALVQRPDFNWKNPGYPQSDDRPVTIVTYDDALAFTAWLTRERGRAFTLPTEAQWEHAYRAGSRGAYYAGTTDKDALDLGWFKPNAGGGPHPVGQKKANAFGLYDMAGNVSEWCLDWYAPYPASAVTDPVATTPDGSDKARRVLRGGSWLQDPSHGRAASRGRSTPGSRNADNGFRVAALATSPRAASPPASPSPSPAPAADPAPPPPSSAPVEPAARARSSPEEAVVGIGCLGTILGAIVTLAMLVKRGSLQLDGTQPPAPPLPPKRRHRQRSRELPAGPGIRFQTSLDGFRIFAPSSASGATLVYRYRGPDGVVESQVLLEPSEAGQFIYTGYLPVDMEVVRVVGPGSTQYDAPPSSPPPPPHQESVAAPVVVQEVIQHHHHDDGGFRGFPPAY